MDLEYFKDILFDLINDCEQYDLADLTVRDRENLIRVTLRSGTVLELTVREASPSPD